MADKDTSREKRGEIDAYFKAKFERHTNDYLIGLLNDQDPQFRTAAATVLGERRCAVAINILCKRLVKEKALYSKIAISEALGHIGHASLNELLKYVGGIGKNQHKELPKEIFKKWSYPLPRDIVIRTIVKMGKPVLIPLREMALTAESDVTAELIDAIGHISFYTGDQNALPNLIEVLKMHKKNQIVVWKLLRALQSFSQKESLDILSSYFLTDPMPALRWEAARSLGQLKAERILRQGLNDSDQLVKQMIVLALDHIEDYKFKVR